MANTIYIGSVLNPTYTITDAELVGASASITSAIVCDELAIDQFNPIVSEAEAHESVLFIPSGSDRMILSNNDVFGVIAREERPYKDLKYGTPVYWYHDTDLQGKFYLSNVDRISKYEYRLNCVSAIGILDGLTHYGNVYTGNSLEDVLDEIIDDDVAYSVDSSIANIKVIGWLPIDSKRNNLHQLLFATGTNITKDANGDIVFGKLSDAVSVTIPDDRIFIDGSISYNSPANNVDITEHTFEKLPIDKETVLFDNTDGSGTANATVITFSKPCHDLYVTGALAIIESGVNYAKVSGVGKLIGQEYTHTTHIISKTTVTNAEPKTVSVTDATLVSVLNSQNVADRVLSYYSSARTISSDLIVEDEKPSNIATFTNAYGDQETALIASMDINASSFLRAACSMIANYTPTGEGNNFNTSIVLTGNGTWTKPQCVTRLRAVLIGGGQGGQSGGNGANGSNGTNSSFGAGGSGGTAGQGGSGGKIFLIDTESVEASYNYSCGTGGAGGIASSEEPVDGALGTATTFGTYSSANGTPSDSGIPNILSGVIYGLTGNAGLDGGDGGQPNVNATGKGEDVSTYQGGAQCATVIDEYGTAYGGGGGGAALGGNGTVGGTGRTHYTSQGQTVSWIEGGDGGNGASASAQSATTVYGQGGNGGHGGGGGGGGSPGQGIDYGRGGTGGTGGTGGVGASGCIILYY